MTRRAMRRTRELREERTRELTSAPRPIRLKPNAPQPPGKGVDYEVVSNRWVCNRKKVYPSEEVAKRVANKLNLINATEKARPGYEGVIVFAYSCSRCGLWHIGR